MDFNLIISAQTLRLAPDLQLSETTNGVFVIKNVPAKTYLRVTPEQWVILRLFEQPRMVPAVLDHAIRERLCLPIGEFFELILKAVRNNILLEPNIEPPIVKACTWYGAVRGSALARPLGVLFLVGMVMSLGFRPELPSSVLDVVAGFLILSVAYSAAAVLIGSIIRGSEGEVYQPRWEWLAVPPRFAVDASDAVMLNRKVQDLILSAEPAVLATAAGLTTWHRPEWGFVPLLGLMLNLRPIAGGRFSSVIRIGHEDAPSDAAQAFLFPPNRGPQARLRLLRRALGQLNTWVTVSYGVIWTLIIIYLAARLTDTPPWSIAFWDANGVRIATAIATSLAGLGLVYGSWEAYQFVRDRARAWRLSIRQWYARWFGGQKILLDEAGRQEAIARSPLLRLLNPPQRLQLLQAMKVERHGPWRTLAEYDTPGAKQAALIVSGRLSLRRQVASGRKAQVQMLGPGDVIGLHDLADPKRPEYYLRTLTPVTLLTVDRTAAETLIAERMPIGALTNTLLKLPFLRQIPLCANWHAHAIDRFALMSSINEYSEDYVIFNEGMFVDRFFIIFEGDALVLKNGRKLAVVKAGEFFGEIGLMQNSVATAAIHAHRNTRCIVIARNEFLRFVTHNYSVALELERVSSERLKRPIFPLRPGDFRVT